MASLSTSSKEGQQPQKLKVAVYGTNKLPRSAGVSSGGSSTGSGRAKSKKIKLGPGFSQMDWIRLNSRAKDMNGLGGKPPSKAITRAELRKHNSQYDCWMVLHGKVYNVTKYIPYHPGGFDEVMRGAGIDGTKLFDDNHSWVSIDGFLEKCYVGDFLDDDNKKDDEAVTKVAASTGGTESVSWDDLDGLL